MDMPGVVKTYWGPSLMGNQFKMYVSIKEVNFAKPIPPGGPEASVSPGQDVLGVTASAVQLVG